MREHPLLMKGPLVRATLAGRKTQIRKPVRIGSVTASGGTLHQEWVRIPRSKEILLLKGEGAQADLKRLPVACPLGQVGDRLWVRETWQPAMYDPKSPADCLYRADDNGGVEDLGEGRWIASIHMPRWACRLVLPLVSVRVERVQDITEEDAIAEGVPHNCDHPIDKEWCATCLGHGIVERFAMGTVDVDDCTECDTAQKLFRNIWVHLYGQEAWDLNPWVWVAEWKDIEVRT